jgi:amino acid permease
LKYFSSAKELGSTSVIEMAEEKTPDYGVDVEGSSTMGLVENVDGLHRRLNNRQIQWIAIGGSIGTALFVSIGWVRIPFHIT